MVHHRVLYRANSTRNVRTDCAIAIPRTQESRPTWRDGCLAREMRKPNHATRTAAGALLLFWDLRLLVRHVSDRADEVDGMTAFTSRGLAPASSWQRRSRAASPLRAASTAGPIGGHASSPEEPPFV
jgi:hypothetical protein